MSVVSLRFLLIYRFRVAHCCSLHSFKVFAHFPSLFSSPRHFEILYFTRFLICVRIIVFLSFIYICIFRIEYVI